MCINVTAASILQSDATHQMHVNGTCNLNVTIGKKISRNRCSYEQETGKVQTLCLLMKSPA